MDLKFLSAGGPKAAGIVSGGAVQKETLVIGGKVATASSDAAVEDISRSTELSPSQVRAGKYQSLTTLKNVADVAGDAISKIAELTEKENNLVAEISTTAQGSRTTELYSELLDVSAEKRRVFDEAKVNGQNVVNRSSLLSIDTGDGSDESFISLTDVSSLFTRSYSATVPLSQSAATSLLDTTEAELSAAQTFSSRAASTQQSATILVSDAVTQIATDVSAATDVNEAEELAASVRQEILSNYSTGDARTQLIDATIGSLSGDTASSLLSG